MKFIRNALPLALVASSIATVAMAEADTSVPAKFACNGIATAKGETELEVYILAEAILIASGVAPDRLRRNPPPEWEKDEPKDYEAAVITAVIEPPASLGPLTVERINEYRRQFSQNLNNPSITTKKRLGLTTIRGGPANEDDLSWVFTGSEVKIACLSRPPEQPTDWSAPPPYRAWEVVGGVADLGGSPKDRDGVKSAMFNFAEETTVKDGAEKTKTKFSFDGTLAYRPSEKPRFLYVNYTGSKERLKPAKELKEGEHEDDADMDAWEVGLLWKDIIVRGHYGVSGKLAHIWDEVKGARRGVIDLTIDPGFDQADVGPCKFGDFKDVSIGRLDYRYKCYLYPRLAYSHVYEAGRAEFDDRSDFLSAGLLFGVRTLPPTGQKNGFVTGISYLWLPTVDGKAPDVNRWDAELKYRWWLRDGGVGLDFGLTYKNGRELKTYTDEDKLLLGFGLVY